MCKVGTVRFIARKNNWEIENVTAELVQEVARGEGGLKTTIQIKMIIEGNLSEEQKEGIDKTQADRCYIHRLLNSEWDIMPITL